MAKVETPLRNARHIQNPAFDKIAVSVKSLPKPPPRLNQYETSQENETPKYGAQDEMYVAPMKMNPDYMESAHAVPEPTKLTSSNAAYASVDENGRSAKHFFAAPPDLMRYAVVPGDDGDDGDDARYEIPASPNTVTGESEKAYGLYEEPGVPGLAAYGDKSIVPVKQRQVTIGKATRAEFANVADYASPGEDFDHVDPQTVGSNEYAYCEPSKVD